MANAVKVLIVEQNGSELQDATELDLTASNIPFSDSNFSQTDVNAAIVQAGTFGMKIQFAEDTTETSTTSVSVWSIKVTLSATALPAGTYVLLYDCIHRTANSNRETDVRVMDGSTTLFQVRSSLIRLQGSLQVAGFIPLTGVSGNKTYTLEFKVGDTNTTSYLKDARLMLWRLS